MNQNTDRRSFLKTSLATLAGVSLLRGASAEELLAAAPKDMATRRFGRTGHRVKIYSLGGQATLEKADTDAESDAIIHRALDLGINYIDTAAGYGRGISETYIGRVMKTRRNEVFLATKTNDRTYDGAMRQLEQSLKNLQTDQLDSWQVHNVRSMEDIERIFADDGVIKAIEEVRSQKIARFVGITGHRDPFVLAEGIRRYNFDTVLMAVNAADRHHNSFIENLIPITTRMRLGTIGMKIPARGRLFKEGGITSMEKAMCYVMSQRIDTIIVGVDTVDQLEKNVAVARAFKTMPRKEQRELELLTASYHEEAAYFKHG
jgi:uncharacterized protein